MNIRSSEPQMSTYLHTKGRALGMPIGGNFELTGRCNFSCPMCYVHQTQKEIEQCGKKELTARQWLDLARQARDRGLIFALLTGGEPLIRKDFFEIYDGMKQMGLLISINSNGSMLRGEILERFLQDPPYRFNISLYGGSNETYSRMCGLPMYDQVKENIRRLRQAGVQVALNLSVTPYNCDDLERIYRDALELDVNVKAAFYMYPPIRINGQVYGSSRRLSAEEAAACNLKWDRLRFTREEFELRARRLAELISVDTDGCPMEEGEGVRCRAGSSSFWLTWDGKMLPCGMMTEPAAYPLEVGFDAAWEQIKAATARIRMPAQCASCAKREICGVCTAVCYAETGRFDGVPEYVCEKADHLVELTRKAYEERNSHED